MLKQKRQPWPTIRFYYNSIHLSINLIKSSLFLKITILNYIFLNSVKKNTFNRSMANYGFYLKKHKFVSYLFLYSIYANFEYFIQFCLKFYTIYVFFSFSITLQISEISSSVKMSKNQESAYNSKMKRDSDMRFSPLLFSRKSSTRTCKRFFSI